MKRIFNFFCQSSTATKFMLFSMTIFSFSGIQAQEKPSIRGLLMEQKTNQVVAFASVALIRTSDSAMINGAVSDENGLFTISPVLPGKYRLRASIVGYNPETENILVNQGVTDAGTIRLTETVTVLKELEVVAEGAKAKSESDKTTYFMTKKILDASSTGMDVMKLIPGVQVDLMQNISVEGSRNIQIFVDGRERDGSYVSQLDPGKIERVEVISKPSANYDGNTTGAINIILKKERNSGIDGQVCTEIPTSFSEIYLRPNFSLNWGFKKLNVYTSYKGEMTYLNLHESTIRKSWNSSTNEITSNQYVRQKDWSHRVNFGIDYFVSAHDQLSFFGFYNPWSRELDGTADSRLSGNINQFWQARKEDSDANTGTFYSLDYNHQFKQEGRSLAIEISDYRMKGKNSTEYFPIGTETSTPEQINSTEPVQNITNVKIDFTSRLGKKFDFSTGVKTKIEDLQDNYLTGFQYNEKIYAAYGTIIYKYAKYFLSLGLRAEESVSTLKNNFSNSLLSFFPNTTFSYKPTSRQTIQLSFNNSIRRPDIYQLNPHVSIDDPYTVSKGNPFLQPELRSNLFVEYSVQVRNNYLAARLFYNRRIHVINNLTFINDTGAFETQVQNMGTINQYGLQFSGSIKMGIVTVNPFLQIYELNTSGNSIAKQYGIENRQNFGYNSGLSAILSFKHEFSFSAVFQYATPKNEIQGNSFCDALYYLSLEKIFKQNIRIGIVSALPFTRSFTYNGSETDGPNFTSHYEGITKLSAPLCWFKLSYQFSSGKNRDKIERSTEEIESRPKKGF